MKVLGDLTIKSGATLGNELHDKTIFLEGNWIDENTTFSGFIPGRGLVRFEGSSAQTINVSFIDNFYDLEIENANGVDLSPSAANTGIDISNRLYLTSGKLRSYSNKLVTVSNTAD
jgi:hypothetical protein